MSDEIPQTAAEILSSLNQYVINYTDFEDAIVIGKGSYGEVYVATHKPTGMRVSVKKLFLEKLEGPHLLYFCREVMVLSRCHSPFLLQFLGFTPEAPYCIVTDYITNGSLFDALHHKPNAPELTGSHKSIIAMGIAAGMAALHDDSIIHRDLKSLNILLDDQLYPKICDFGISRFVEDTNNWNTSQIGTPHWMAPEMFKNEPYGNKVDVYAYGILLWEMLTEGTPFKGMSGVQIGVAVLGNQRPSLPEDTPHGLANLIQCCWHMDPEKRPTFRQIITHWIKKKVYFNGTDPRMIDNAVETFHQKNVFSAEQESLYQCGLNSPMLRKKYQNMLAQRATMTRGESYSAFYPQTPKPKRRGEDREGPRSKEIPETPQALGAAGKIKSLNNLFEDAKPVGNRGPLKWEETPGRDSMMPSEPVDIPHTPPPPHEENVWSILKDRKHPEFYNVMQSMISTLPSERATKFFNIVLQHLRTPLPLKVIIVIVSGFAKLVTSGDDYVHAFLKCQGQLYMAYDQARILDPLIDILSAIARVDMPSVPIQGVQKMMKNVAGREKKLLDFLSVFKQLTEPTVIDVYKEYAGYADVFLQVPAVSITFLEHMYRAYTENKKAFSSTVIRVFCRALVNRDPNVVVTAYKCIDTMDIEIHELPIEEIVAHITRQDVAVHAIQFLRNRPRDLPMSKRLVRALVKAGNVPEAGTVLLSIASRKDGAALVAANLGWMNKGAMLPDDQVKIFLALFQIKELRAQLTTQPASVIDILCSTFPNPGSEVIQSMVWVIRRIPNLSKDFVTIMGTSGFLKQFISVAFASEDFNCIKSGILLFDALARVGYVPDYCDVVRYIPSIVSLGPQVHDCAMSMIVVLSYYPEVMECLRSYRIADYALSMQVTESMAKFRDNFLERYQGSRKRCNK